jgi:NAD(P)-dependent dehydrogenase (short-subunit alcohol dehydrogenase family)
MMPKEFFMSAAVFDPAAFRNKTALITGGTSGIGKVTALALARHGAHVVVTGRRAAEGEAVAAEVRRLGGAGVQGVFVQGDVTDEKHVEAAVAKAVSLTGTLDFAFNNAGIELGHTPTSEATPEHYRKVMDINVLGVLLSMKHEIRAMLKNNNGKGAGSIVNTSSIAGSIGMAGAGIYIASKHAVNGLTKSAALEVAKNNIRVNTVSPGGVDTAMLDRFTGNKHPDAMAWMNSMHPVGRIATPDEIAQPVLFLFSSASTFVTGSDLLVDGAFTTA